jgi:predicted RNase H-like HicB family nuclease
MLTDYINAAMSKAEYEDIGDEGWFARIPGFAGLWASAPTLDETRKELRSTLEDWLLIGLRLDHPLPVVDGLDLNVRHVA